MPSRETTLTVPDSAPLADGLAVVVTYNPDGGLAARLAALRAQVEAVVVIDNGSVNLDGIAAAARSSGCRLVENGRNLGIAAALSQAAGMAVDGGYEWLATFDQDSSVRPGSIAGMLEVYRSHPARDRIGVISLSHRDRATGRDYHLPWDILAEGEAWRSVRSAITSGNLIPVRTFERVGRFDDRLFIDSVDHEFCLRCRASGLLIIECRRQVLDHAKGDATEHRFLGLKVPSSNHSASRRYYIARNQLELFRRFALVDPAWVCLSAFLLACEAVIILLYETDRRAKFAAMIAGARDAVLRRFGPRRLRSGA